MFKNIHFFKSILIGLIALFILGAAACGSKGTDTPPDVPPTRAPDTDIVIAYDGWIGTYLPSYVLKSVLEDRLGYTVSIRDQGTIPKAFEAVDGGRADIFVSAWFPVRDSTFDKFPNLVKLGQPYGGKARDAFEGWMISSDVGREYRVQHVRDLSSPELAQLLGGQVIGCPADWTCAGKHQEILKDNGLESLYTVVVPTDGSHHVEMVEERLKSGQPALFYMLQPVGFKSGLNVTDVATWLDGTSSYLPSAFDRSIVRSDFIANFPGPSQVLNRFKVSGADIGWAMGRIEDKGDSEKFLNELAKTWIEGNQALVDSWVAGIPNKASALTLSNQTLKIAFSPEKEELFLDLAVKFNLARAITTPAVEPIRVGMKDMMRDAIAGEYDAISPDSSVWLDQLDNQWIARNPSSAGLVGERARFALSPIVLAMWEDTAADLGYPAQPVGWASLIEKASKDPRFKWSHSSAVTAPGLLTTVAEFYAGAGKDSGLTEDDLKDETVREFVRNVENTLRRYGGESDEQVVIRMLAEGGRPLDAFVSQEQAVIFYNQNSDRQKLISVYPAEGTFWMDHPLVLLDATWVTAEKTQAFKDFGAFVNAKEQQELVLAKGYRSVDPSLSANSAGSLISAQFGANPDQPKSLLTMPSDEVLEQIREAWRVLKKPANIYLVVDVSGSMSGEKIQGAKAAMLSFLDQVNGANDQVALVPFSTGVEELVSLGAPDRKELADKIIGLQPNGGTELYDAVAFALKRLKENGGAGRINVIVAMTDGISSGTIETIERELGAEGDPTLIFTVGYGSDIEFDVLQRIARLGEGQAYPSDSDTIEQLYEFLSAFF